jgi:hypothetical protein
LPCPADKSICSFGLSSFLRNWTVSAFGGLAMLLTSPVIKLK